MGARSAVLRHRERAAWAQSQGGGVRLRSLTPEDAAAAHGSSGPVEQAAAEDALRAVEAERERLRREVDAATARLGALRVEAGRLRAMLNGGEHE
jgi:hypothetical protein